MLAVAAAVVVANAPALLGSSNPNPLGPRSELVSSVTGTRPMIDRSQVDEFAGKYAYFSSQKAARELGYTWRPAREVVTRTIAWIVDRGMVTAKRQATLRLHGAKGAAS